MIKFGFILIPFASRNIRLGGDDGYTGFTDYYIFGIRIARIQGTKPWPH